MSQRTTTNTSREHGRWMICHGLSCRPKPSIQLAWPSNVLQCLISCAPPSFCQLVYSMIVSIPSVFASLTNLKMLHCLYTPLGAAILRLMHHPRDILEPSGKHLLCSRFLSLLAGLPWPLRLQAPLHDQHQLALHTQHLAETCSVPVS